MNAISHFIYETTVSKGNKYKAVPIILFVQKLSTHEILPQVFLRFPRSSSNSCVLSNKDTPAPLLQYLAKAISHWL